MNKNYHQNYSYGSPNHYNIKEDEEFKSGHIKK